MYRIDQQNSIQQSGQFIDPKLALSSSSSSRSISSSKPIKILSIDLNGNLVFEPQGRQFLQTLRAPICLISLIGPVRKGKSLLLNYWANRLKPNTNPEARFTMSDQLSSFTKGIYILPEPINIAGVNYYFVDCQGTENQKDEDLQIFTLICLISSLCVFQMEKTLTYQHDFLLPYLRAREFFQNEKAKSGNVPLLLNPHMQILFLVRDCPDKRLLELKQIFNALFLEERIPLNASNQLKKEQLDMRRLTCRLLKQQFGLTSDRLVNLPYYLNESDDNIAFRDYNSEINEYILSETFKAKANAIANQFIYGKLEALSILQGNVNYHAVPIAGDDLSKIIGTYVNLINKGQIDDLFRSIESSISRIKEDLSTYCSNLIKSYIIRPSKYLQMDDRELNQYYQVREHVCFQKLRDYVNALLKHYCIELPEIKVNQIIENQKSIVSGKIKEEVRDIVKEVETSRKYEELQIRLIQERKQREKQEQERIERENQERAEREHRERLEKERREQEEKERKEKEERDRREKERLEKELREEREKHLREIREREERDENERKKREQQEREERERREERARSYRENFMPIMSQTNTSDPAMSYFSMPYELSSLNSGPYPLENYNSSYNNVSSLSSGNHSSRNYSNITVADAPSSLPRRHDGFLDLRYSVNQEWINQNHVSNPRVRDLR